LTVEAPKTYPEGKPLACDWCRAPGKDLGPEYGSLRIAGCTSCHHEWTYVPADEEVNP
jgi:hypothetical protein